MWICYFCLKKNNKFFIIYLFLNRNINPLIYQQWDARDVENPKLTGHRMTADFSVLNNQWSLRQWPNDPFPSEIFLSLSMSSVLTMMYLDEQIQFGRIIPGLQLYMGLRRSVQVFVFSPIVAS